MTKKKRADELVVEQGLVESRNKAQALIMAGLVFYKKNDTLVLVEKAGQQISSDAELSLSPKATHQDVGRGAQKLRRAFEQWPLDVTGQVAIDVGSSTGGFTQVLLEKGAKKVVALDVGTNQLHEKLRNDSRVVSIEQQHVLKVEAALWSKHGLELPFDFAVTDLSFISLTKILPTVSEWLRPNANWVLLVKPQFELEPKKTPGGIVKNPEHQQEAVDRVRQAVKDLKSWNWKDLVESPILGGDGNKEFLLWIQKQG